MYQIVGWGEMKNESVFWEKVELGIGDFDEIMIENIIIELGRSEAIFEEPGVRAAS
jgi:hypothetical protein